jgi:hypothetical protein
MKAHSKIDHKEIIDLDSDQSNEDLLELLDSDKDEEFKEIHVSW